MNQQQSSSGSPPMDYHSEAFNYPPNPHVQNEKPINWRKYIFLLLRNWYWFLITLGIALGVAFFKIRYNVPRYKATATLIIQEEENTQDLLGELRSVRYWRRRADMANEKAILSSFTTLNRAVDSLNQDIYWTGHGRIRVRPLYKNALFTIDILNDSMDWYLNKEWFIDYIDPSSYRFYQEGSIDTILPLNSVIDISGWQFIIKLAPNDSGHRTYSFVVNDPISLANSFRKKLKIETGFEEGSIIKLESEGSVGEREVDFINTLCYTYISAALERKQEIAENTSAFIEDQIIVILDSLHQSENQLLTFRLTNNAINLSREGEIAYEHLKSFHEQRTQSVMKANYYLYLKNYIDERNDPKMIIAPTLIDANDRVLIEAVTELQNLYEERENLNISVMENNPGLGNINKRISAIRLRIIVIISGLIENNQLAIKQINAEEEAIVNQLRTLPVNEQQLLNITRKYDLYNQFYTYLLQKRAESGIQKASVISNARILDPARYDQILLIGKNKMTMFMFAVALGLLLPALIIILNNTLDSKIRERDDITNTIDIPIIGNIGHAKDSNLLPISEDPNSPFAESLRRIRTNLNFALKGKEHKVIIVTSSISGEGKTFTAANLAAIIAMNNKKVLLIGGDLRKPTLHQIFNVPKDIGITSFLVNEKEINEVILPTFVENLFLLPAGPVPPNPAELLETDRTRDLITQVKSQYDYIIIDTPPVVLVADAFSLASYADLTLYIVRQNYSNKHVLEVASTLNNENKLPKTYLLVNDIQPSRSMGFSYYYGYGEGYNYGYYSDHYMKKNTT